MKQPKRVKRCSAENCTRIIRTHNKKGLCRACNVRIMDKLRKRKSCSICEESCCGKMLIEYKKGYLTSVCTFHFNWLLPFTDMKELRAEIKRLKGCH